jgi:hypothetical protein
MRQNATKIDYLIQPVSPGSKMIFSEPILTTFIVSVFLKAARQAAKIGSSLKLNHHKQI